MALRVITVSSVVNLLTSPELHRSFGSLLLAGSQYAAAANTSAATRVALAPLYTRSLAAVIEQVRYLAQPCGAVLCSFCCCARRKGSKSHPVQAEKTLPEERTECITSSELMRPRVKHLMEVGSFCLIARVEGNELLVYTTSPGGDTFCLSLLQFQSGQFRLCHGW